MFIFLKQRNAVLVFIFLNEKEEIMKSIRNINKRRKTNFETGINLGMLNASWNICSLVVNGQLVLDMDGYLLNLFKVVFSFYIEISCLMKRI